jgi:hypothetical protein
MKYRFPIATLFCLVASFAFGQGSYVAFPVQTATGAAIPGASVALCSTTEPTTATPCGGSSLQQTYATISGTACTLNPAILGPTYGAGCTNPGLTDGFGMARLYASPNTVGSTYYYQTYGQTILVPDVEPVLFPGGATGGSGTVNNCGTAGLLAFYESTGTAVSCDPNVLDLDNLLTISDANGVELAANGSYAGAAAFVGGTPPAFGSSAGQIPTTGYLVILGPANTTAGTVALQPPAALPSPGSTIIIGTEGTCTGSVSTNCYPFTYGNSSGGGNPTLDNCTPDQTGNSFPSVLSLTEYFYAPWSFVFNTSTYINCTVYIPTAATGATIVLDIAANDSTAGHTAYFQTCDGVINSGTINISSLTCAAEQTFTTTSTAYNRVTLTFNVQSTLSNGSILVVKIATITTGTAPTANMLVYPHFVL